MKEFIDRTLLLALTAMLFVSVIVACGGFILLL